MIMSDPAYGLKGKGICVTSLFRLRLSVVLVYWLYYRV